MGRRKKQEILGGLGFDEFCAKKKNFLYMSDEYFDEGNAALFAPAIEDDRTRPAFIIDSDSNFKIGVIDEDCLNFEVNDYEFYDKQDANFIYDMMLLVDEITEKFGE